MTNIQFVFRGGLGNQIFQYFASKYIEKNVKNLNLSYALSDHILSGYNNFELDKLIKKPIDKKKEFTQLRENVYLKLIKNLPFLTNLQKLNLKSKIDLLNCLYYEKENFGENPLSTLEKDLYFLKRRINKLKVKGYWQNPNCYIDNLDYYRNLLIDTKQLIKDKKMPDKYISIHVRRGDYILNKTHFNNYFSKFSTIKFILLALNLLPQESDDMPIYLISDDKDWTNNLLPLLSNTSRYRFFTLDSNNHFEDWAILRHSSINICSNSTFSYTAALLNYENLDQKLRCIVPQWFSQYQSAFEKGWLSPKGFIEI